MRGRPRDPGNDAAILQAALDIFIEGGVEGTSIEQVARRAGVARLTVYRRWATKEELIAQAIEFGRDGFMNPADFLQRFTSGEQTLDSMVELVVQALVDPRYRQLLGRLAATSASHPDLMRAYAESYVSPRREMALEVFQVLKENGEIPEHFDLGLFTELVAGMSMYITVLAMPPRSPAEIREFLHRLLDMVLSRARTSNPG
ncbi:AcrR family transcriptional regulator [Crossiella equi]|uniref:AcrR family transcriptional regulator n=1 Tax=Crossiella equi TaxID=130796 RepID=A0ABS5AH47_9PSEU|nr:TetR/AcrR family transcriptional regulator [Crossiella equi]MBP2475677.1 AcrR family transcriptional regulator [Crossiella equi]